MITNIYNPIAGVNRLKELDDILANVKVADLAVGSGAFPLGMLNEIVKARETLSAYMSIGMNAFQKKTFYAYDRKSYDLKVNTIKNCIFACDIEPSAVDIAKLRLWLSIVIDDEITEDAGNGEFDAHSKPRQLPNLDCNIICGNSLMDEFQGSKLITESILFNNVSDNSQLDFVTLHQQGIDSMINKLIELQDELFFTKEHDEKEEIKANIQKIYDKIEFVPEAELAYEYEVLIVQWSQSLGKEFSKFYFIDSDNEEKYKEATKLNKKSDEFFHSIFIKSSYFDNFYFEKEMDGQACLFPNKNEPEYKNLMDSINDFLYKFRRQYLKEASDKFIDKLIDSKIYPEFNESNPIDTYRKSELDNLVGTLYAAQPKIFTNLSDDNKKITISLLKLIMDAEDKDNLFKVLKQVVDLEEDELAELAGVLKYTSLSNITRLVKMIEDRQMVIQGLKELVFNKEMYAKEVPHIQSIVENHYWLFGEQYNLITAAEPDFTLALKGLILATTGKEEDVDIDHEDKNKEMDIFMIRQDRKGDVTENVVVELKRPTVALGETQLSQVKKYLQVIRKEDRFNMGNVKWTFYLVGNKFNTSGFLEGELENNKNHGEQHLVYWVDNGMTKIYVLKWSEIFDEFSKRHEYLLDKLKLEEAVYK